MKPNEWTKKVMSASRAREELRWLTKRLEDLRSDVERCQAKAYDGNWPDAGYSIGLAIDDITDALVDLKRIERAS